MSGAAYNTGKSRQDYETPIELIAAVEIRFGKLDLDLAAWPHNSKGTSCITPDNDSLLAEWPIKQTGISCWLNPPFARIGPWAKKCYESQAAVKFLVPASVGSDWFRDYVFGKALVLFLQPRIPFDPANPTWGFPKDCILAVYGEQPGFEMWRWK